MESKIKEVEINGTIYTPKDSVSGSVAIDTEGFGSGDGFIIIEE